MHKLKSFIIVIEQSKVVLLANEILYVTYIIIEIVILYHFLRETFALIDLVVSFRFYSLPLHPRRKVDFDIFLS
jgi:hypothetical protein